VLGFSERNADNASRGGSGEVGVDEIYVILGLFGGGTRRVVRSKF
jgi:hypothetical protein